MSIADKLAEIGENEQKVYEAGYEKGNQTGYDTGRNDEWSDFWDAFQDNGTRTNYHSAFKTGWNNNNFKPKYDIVVENGYQIFNNNSTLTKSIAYEDLGIVINFSKATTLTQAFNGARIPKIGVIDVSSAQSVQQLLAYNYATHTVEKIISNKNTVWSKAFEHATALKNITFEGVIESDFYIRDSKALSKESISSIIKTLSTAASGLVVTFSLSAINTAFETSLGAADGSTSEEWTALEGTKTNWTISLV